MKLTNWFLSLSLAGLCLNQASAQSYTPPAPARHIGDSLAADDRPEEFRTAKSRTVSHVESVDYGLVAPTSSSYVSDHSTHSHSSGDSCGLVSSCTTSPSTWFTAETLLWFGKDQNAPALATTSAQGVLPVAGATGVTTVFGGGEGISTGLLPGYRLSAGKYFGDCDQFGLGGRVFGIYSNNEQFNATSNGATSLGVPFYNLNGPFNDAYLVGFTTAGNAPVAAGSLNARADLDMVFADGSLYVLLGKSNDHRIDLLGGYTFTKLKSSVGLQTESTNLFTGDLIPDGTIFSTNDLFSTENVFNGGHLGVLSTVVQRRVSLSTLAKISFGNMRQSGTIEGFTVQNDGAAINNFAGGLFAQQSNIGTFSRDEFAFIPELGIKLGYNFRENINFTVGYTFLMYSSVMLAGDQMDSTLDLSQVNGPMGTRPTHTPIDTTYWLQGVDLGLSWTF